MDLNHHSEIGIETLPTMFVGRYQMVSPSPEEDGGTFLMDWLEKRGLRTASMRKFGFDIDVTAADSQAGRRGYEHWATVPAGTQPGDGVTMQTYQGGLYATLTLYKPFDDPFYNIPNGWKILHEWVIGSEKYQGGQHQWMEEMLFHTDGNDLKLYYPVMAKKAPGPGMNEKYNH